jgi:hypothetical protein
MQPGPVGHLLIVIKAFSIYAAVEINAVKVIFKGCTHRSIQMNVAGIKLYQQPTVFLISQFKGQTSTA